MAYKPSDFFLGAVHFFGILVPGAVLLFLHGHLLLIPLGWENVSSHAALWVAFLVGSYVVGGILFGIGLLLDWLYVLLRPERSDHYFREIENHVHLPDAVKKDRNQVFHRAYSTLRLTDCPGLAEIERQMAEYKLFRSLVLVFAIDTPLVFFCGAPHWSRYVVSILLCGGSLVRFLVSIGWTQRLTFEYYHLMRKSTAESDGETEQGVSACKKFASDEFIRYLTDEDIESIITAILAVSGSPEEKLWQMLNKMFLFLQGHTAYVARVAQENADAARVAYEKAEAARATEESIPPTSDSSDSGDPPPLW